MIAIERTQNAKLTKLTLGTVTIWFSYETPVAYQVRGIAGVVVSDKGWSETTRRHIAAIPGRRAPIAHEYFEWGLDAISQGTDLGANSDVLGAVGELVERADAAKGERIALIGLDARARALYDAEAGWREFAAAFTFEELEQLATLCQIQPDGSGGRSYDDEVFDALSTMKAV